MNAISHLEADILQRITVALTNPEQVHPKIDVQAWPDRPADFKMLHPQGAALLVYKGKKYSDNVKNDDKAEFELAVMARTLHEPSTEVTLGTGMYELLSTCIDALHGWRSEHATRPLTIGSDTFNTYGEGVWSYSIRFIVPVFPRINLPPTIGPWAEAADGAGVNAPHLNQTTYLFEPQIFDPKSI